MRRTEGPECPGCGCRDTVHKRPGRGRGIPWIDGGVGRYRCRNCAREFFPAVYYPDARCPTCGSADVPVTSTRRPVRHHKCRDCRSCFTSHERDADRAADSDASGDL